MCKNVHEALELTKDVSLLSHRVLDEVQAEHRPQKDDMKIIDRQTENRNEPDEPADLPCFPFGGNVRQGCGQKVANFQRMLH